MKTTNVFKVAEGYIVHVSKQVGTSIHEARHLFATPGEAYAFANSSHS